MANPFTHHPQEVGESYGEHLAVAGGFGLIMLAGGLCVLVHAIFPFLFERTGSRFMARLHKRMTRRADAVNWERHPII